MRTSLRLHRVATVDLDPAPGPQPAPLCAGSPFPFSVGLASSCAGMSGREGRYLRAGPGEPARGWGAGGTRAASREPRAVCRPGSGRNRREGFGARGEFELRSSYRGILRARTKRMEGRHDGLRLAQFEFADPVRRMILVCGRHRVSSTMPSPQAKIFCAWASVAAAGPRTCLPACLPVRPSVNINHDMCGHGLRLSLKLALFATEAVRLPQSL